MILKTYPQFPNQNILIYFVMKRNMRVIIMLGDSHLVIHIIINYNIVSYDYHELHGM